MVVCVELPRASAARQITPEPVRLVTAGVFGAGWIMRLTPEDAWIRGGPFLSLGDDVQMEVSGIGHLQCTVKRVEPSGFAVSVWPDPTQRALILKKLHTREGVHGTTQTHPWRLLGDGL